KRQTAWLMMKKHRLEREPQLASELADGIEQGHLLGEAGYDLFAAGHFEGDRRLAWNAARTLLSVEEFRKLKWPRYKRTNVFSQDALRQMVLQGIEDGTYLGEKGYDHFALQHYEGYSN